LPYIENSYPLDLRILDFVRQGRKIKTIGNATERGIDGRGKIKGRKRHIMTDTEGHILHVEVHAANSHDTVAGGSIFQNTLKKYPFLPKLFKKDSRGKRRYNQSF
jgi:hypothetical protein